MQTKKATEEAMIFATRATALASLREFSPAYRKAHRIVRFFSTTHNAYRYCRVFGDVRR